MSAPVKLKDDRALDPVRDRLLQRARADAEKLVGEARIEAAATIAAAEARSRTILDQARARGAALAAADTAELLTAARREARALDLAAQRAVYDAVRDGIEHGIRALRDSADYPAVRAALEHRARDALGSEAVIVDDEGGGVTATARGRRLDLSLPAIAARAVDGLGEEVARLWTI
ncbi:hypothetical protein [Actinocrinis sp.]|uniref:hypothetical protein n=1 Tax=Actinocrinis sp. TaxID=1920516 RepID=UPI002D5EA789|nr:hypothetical protein [Actinocrinis sp.]HZP51325.1 hypothetical protein [Actinocrinis sp.]